MIPVWGDKFDNDDVIITWEIKFINHFGQYAANYYVAVTSIWEIIEAGDTYTPCSSIYYSKGKEMTFIIHMKNGKTKKITLQ